MHCTRCGRANPPTSQFCCSCGSALVPSRVCRDGNTIVAPVGATFPLRCVKCGKPVVGRPKEYKFSWHPLWVYAFLPVLLVFIIVAVVQNRSMRVSFSLCDRHRRFFARLRIAGWVALGTGPILTVVSATAWGDDAAALIWLGILAAVGGLALLLVKPIRPTRIESTYGKFRSAGPGFLAVIPEAGAYQSNSPSTSEPVEPSSRTDSPIPYVPAANSADSAHLLSPNPLTDPPSVHESVADERGVPASQTTAGDSTVDAPLSGTVLPLYGTMSQRFAAYLADLVVIYLIIFGAYFLSGAVGKELPGGDGAFYLIFFIVLFSYMVIAQASYHTTIGKYILSLEVGSALPSEKYPTTWRVILRETLGRLFSSVLWGVGYWRAVGDPRKQAWSDEMASTVVSRRKTQRTLTRALLAFVVVGLVLDVGLVAWGEYVNGRTKARQTLIGQTDSLGTKIQNELASSNQLMSQNPATLYAWQANMREELTQLDSYDADVRQMESLLHDFISQNLANSVSEKQQYAILLKVYELRAGQSAKLRQEANLILNYDPTSDRPDELKSQLRFLDSDIAALDNQASQLLTQIGDK